MIRNKRTFFNNTNSTNINAWKITLKTKWVILDLEAIDKLSYKTYIFLDIKNKIDLTIWI